MGKAVISRFRTDAVVVLLAFVAALAFFVYPSLHARYLFDQLETLQLGHSTYEDAERLAKKIDAKSDDWCSSSDCEWSKRMDNAQFPRWWRGVGEAFVVSFEAKDSIVMRKNTGFGIGDVKSFNPSSTGLIEQENWGRSNRPVPVAAGWQTTDLFRYYQFTVYMTPKASAQDRQRYTAFNYSCFWKYKGCVDARELLPTADPFPEDAFSGGTKP